MSSWPMVGPREIRNFLLISVMLEFGTEGFWLVMFSGHWMSTFGPMAFNALSSGRGRGPIRNLRMMADRLGW
eukprot:6329106-Amphidinium_carterae.1